MQRDDGALGRRASELAQGFGAVVRSRRRALAMSQDQLALATGLGRRFLIELEAGKLSCQLGRALIVAEALGLKPVDALRACRGPTADLPDFPDLPDEEPADG